MLVEAGEEQFAAAGHLLGSGGAEHLLDVLGAGVGDAINLGLGHGDEEEDVAAEKLHGAIDDFGTHGGFSQVCHPEDQRTAGLKAVERGSGAEVVGFAGFSADLGEGLDQLAEVGCAAAGKQALLNALAVGKQADAVAGEESELGEGYGGGAGEVELGVDARAGVGDGQCGLARGTGGDTGTHEAAAVEDDPDGLAARGLILAGDEGAAAGAGGPADIAQVIAFTVVAQALEVAAEASLAGLAELEIDLAAAGEEDLLLLTGAQGGVDTDGLGERGAGPSFGEAEGGAVAHVEPAGFPVAALGGLDAVTHAGRDTGKSGKAVRGGIGYKGGRQIVDQAAAAVLLQAALDAERFLA